MATTLAATAQAVAWRAWSAISSGAPKMTSTASPMNSCEYDTRPFMLSRSSRWASLLFVVFHFSHSRWRSAAEWTPTTAVPFVDTCGDALDAADYFGRAEEEAEGGNFAREKAGHFNIADALGEVAVS